MLIIHKTFRDKKGLVLFGVMIDRAERDLFITRWDAPDDRIQRIRVVKYQPMINVDRLLDEYVRVARQLSLAPTMPIQDAVSEVQIRMRAEDQVVAHRPDASDGDCAVCGKPVKAHFDQNRQRLTCAQAAMWRTR